MSSRYDDPEYQKQVSNQMLATPTLEIACRAITDLRAQISLLECDLENARAGQTLLAQLKKDSDELNKVKRAIMNAFTGGKLFPGDNK